MSMKLTHRKQPYDSLEDIVNPKHTALVLVDVQNDFFSPEGQFAKGGRDVSMLREITPNIVRLVEKARETGVMVIFILNTTSAQGLSDSPSWLRFKTNWLRSGTRTLNVTTGYSTEGTWGQEIYGGLKPQASELVVKKYRSSAFVNTELDLMLRANSIESIIVTGCITDGCVLATAMHGVYYDYYVVVAKDCVGSTDREGHEAALKIMECRLDIVDYQEIIKKWSSA